MNRRTQVVLLSAAFLSSSSPAHGSPQDVLERIRDIYAAVDANKDGRVVLTEATTAGVSAVDFASQDTDRSASLEVDEFVVYYRQLLIRAGSKVPKELDAEIKRAATARAAAKKKAEDEAKAEAKRKAAARAAAESEAATAAARAAAEKAAAQEQAAKRLAEAEAKRSSTPAEADPQQVAPDSVPARVNPDAPAEAPPAPDESTETEDTDPIKVTDLVQRLVDDGALNDQEVRQMRTALQDPKAVASKPQALKAIRDALLNVRPRLGALVQDGKLTGKEARELSRVFKERGRVAATALAALDNPIKAENNGADGESSGASVAEGTQRPKVPAEADVVAPAPSAGGLIAPRAARQIIGRLIKDGSIPREEGRSMTQAVAALPKGTTDLDTLTNTRSAVFNAAARVDVLKQTGKINAEESAALAELFERRSVQVIKALKSAGAPIDVINAPQGNLSDRSQRHVRRLIDQERVSAGEGRLMFQAMADTSTIANDIAQLRSMRDALAAVRPRIGELVRQGHLTSEEGRELSSLFDARATAAAAALAVEESRESRTGVRDADSAEQRPAPQNTRRNRRNVRRSQDGDNGQTRQGPEEARDRRSQKKSKPATKRGDDAAGAKKRPGKGTNASRDGRQGRDRKDGREQ